jgi:head-tail adaptor
MLYQTAEFISQSTYRIVIRYPWGQTIAPNDRIVWESMTFTIDAVINPEMRNRELQILGHVVDEAN